MAKRGLFEGRGLLAFARAEQVSSGADFWYTANGDRVVVRHAGLDGGEVTLSSMDISLLAGAGHITILPGVTRTSGNGPPEQAFTLTDTGRARAATLPTKA